ncbi:MAG: glycine--tRNA ligase subunit beta [Deltaproteobacteria bacterium]|nr:glycine--tRNA ligase subunit beta [Deltaproteobacteria bacterium]
MELLYEIFTEELPAAEIIKLQKEGKEIIKDIFNEYDIDYENLNIYCTPKRITVSSNILPLTKVKQEKIYGPPEQIAFKNGEVTNALKGFLKRMQATTKEIKIEKKGEKRYVFLIKKGKGRNIKPFLPSVLKKFTDSIPFKRKMKWSDKVYSFSRPIHNLLAICDDNIIDLEIAGIKTNNITYGHRFLNNEIKVENKEDYIDKLRKSFVILSSEERREKILNEFREIERNNNVSVVKDDTLLNETIFLNEYPQPILGEFDKSFLGLPKDVLITSMKNHEKCFAVEDKKGNLLPYFIAVTDNPFLDEDVVKKGYQKVLSARFNDALFFYKEDIKQPLSDYMPKLKGVIFHEKLGKMSEKVERLEKLSSYIAEILNKDKKTVKRAAYLCKADLVTQMVYEFPELQGIMGREYALKTEEKDVAQAIYEHYLPKGIKDNLPQTDAGTILSICDRMDNLTGGFLAGLEPTGEKDPYALRRACIGIIRIVIDGGYFLSIPEIIDYAVSLYKRKNHLQNLMDFIKRRFVEYLISNYKIHFDIIMAAVEADFSDIYDTYNRIMVINDLQKKYFLMFKRVLNIIPNSFNKTDVEETLLEEEKEQALYKEFKQKEKEIERLKKEKQYKQVLSILCSFKEKIDDFFDHVMVMTENKHLRENRLKLLCNLRKVFLYIANFDRIEV